MKGTMWEVTEPLYVGPLTWPDEEAFMLPVGETFLVVGVEPNTNSVRLRAYLLRQDGRVVYTSTKTVRECARSLA